MVVVIAAVAVAASASSATVLGFLNIDIVSMTCLRKSKIRKPKGIDHKIR